ETPALQPGPIMTQAGRVIAQHNGFARYTVGQRRGLPGGARRPLYVIAIHPDERAVVVGEREELLASGLVAREINWLDAMPPQEGQDVEVQVRHRGAVAAGTIAYVDGAGARGPHELGVALA